MSNDLAQEARRQIEVCNACRYCEGYCSVFPAITQQKTFSDGDITQLANLCHNCRGCYYACQYAPPHEFALNVPAALAEVRLESWERFAWPGGVARLFQRNGLAMAMATVLGFTVLLGLIGAFRPQGGEGFYAVISHGLMVAIFVPAFLLPLAAVAVSLRRYWNSVGGEPVRLLHLLDAVHMAASLKDLSGGKGQGCNFEKGERYSNTRRWFHQAVLYGFALCFAATAVGTIMHYIFDSVAPYPVFSLPKLLGIPGGVLMVIGCLGLLGLKAVADQSLGARAARTGEVAFIVVLLLVSTSGLALWMATGTEWVRSLLALHLGSVLALFALIPYSKMVHGFFRLAALTRNAQQRQK